MIYGSVCSGIEAATVAWHLLGWRPAFFSEIDPFARAVLAHHWPKVPCHGNFTTIEARTYSAIDVLVGGTPCQSFSVAGLRGGLDDDRGNLALEYFRLADRLRPRWIVWENVPGVLSSNGGRDFGAILGVLGELGYGWAYRILDAQYFGVPQRRRRVFLVGCLGDWRSAAAVLFERRGLQGHPAPSRKAGARIADTITVGANHYTGRETDITEHPLAFGGNNTAGPIEVSTALTAHGGPSGRMDFESETFIAHTLRAKHNLAHRADVDALLASTITGSWHLSQGQIAGNNPGVINPVIEATGVRRLMPVECERLQGFPDHHTAITYRGKPAADGPRYRAIGNSMAVPVMRWIGCRIAIVNAISTRIAA